jgi:hypothetical protein
MRVHPARRAVRLLVVAIAVGALLTAQAVTAAAAEFTYPQRIEILKKLARRYDAGASPGSPLAKYGLWAGTLTQTRWQLDSARDAIELWSLVNFGLTVETTAYANELAASKRTARDPATLCATSAFVRANPTPSTLGPPVDRAAVCEGWMNVFLAERQGVAPDELQKLMWSATTTSIVHSLRVYGGAFTRPDASTELERNFWGSWIELLFALEAMNYPTDGAGSVRITQVLMPPCAPIGGTGCALTPADLRTSFDFVAALASRPMSLERIFAMYDLSRTNPAALAPGVLAYTDPPLATALGIFLTT